MIIQPYEVSQQEELIALWRYCNLVTPQNDPQKDIERKLNTDPENLLVGLVENTLIASCMFGYDGHRGWVNYLAVHPSHRKQGYARALLQAAEQKLKSIGCPKVNLQIRTGNEEVVAFYNALGYTTDPVVCMGKRLIHDQ